MNKESIIKLKIGGGVNALTALLAHIPCCGSQLLMGIFGVQTLGMFSATVLYRYQFIIPIIVSALLTLIFFLISRQNKTKTCCTDSTHNVISSRQLSKFFLFNLLVGYIIVGALYLFIPPHNHRMIDTIVSGSLSEDGHTVSVAYHDPNRFWPWSIRHFSTSIAHAADTPQRVQEKYWYQSLLQSPTPEKMDIPVHFYTRPAAFHMNKLTGLATFRRPLDYYISLDNKVNDLARLVGKKPGLVMFYSDACAPCRIEMSMLDAIKTTATDWPISVVTLTKVDIALTRKFKALGVSKIELTEKDATLMLRSLNNGPLGLPFSVALAKNGTICAQQSGLLGLDKLKEWKKTCSQ